MKDKNQYLPELLNQLEKKEISRYEFLRTSSLLGITTLGLFNLPNLINCKETSNQNSNTSVRSAPKKGGTLRYAHYVQELKDPALSQWLEAANLYRNSLEWLVEIDADNIIKPALAESWRPSNDLTVWAFKLRQGIKWSNGDTFNADDVIFNFNRWIDKNSKSANKTLFASVQGVEKVDDYNIKIYLNKPDLSIPVSLTNYTTPILHRNFEKDGGDWIKNPIGTGPFALKEYKVGQKSVFHKRDSYWGKEVYLDEIHYIDLGENIQTQINALASNQVDLLLRISIDNLPLVKELPNVNLFTAKSSNTYCLRMQVNKKPFDNLLLRKAIVHCADNQQMLKIAYQEQGILAENHHTCPIHPEYFNLPQKPKQNIEKAKEFLKQAGYEKGIDLEITVGNTQGTTEQNTCQILKEQCAKAGINININVMPTVQYWSVWNKAPFSLTYWSHRPLAVMVHSLAYKSDAVWNETKYNNKEYDKTLEGALKIVDPKERSKSMEKIEKMLQEDAIMVQPYWPYLFTVGNKKVQNFRLHPATYQKMNDIWLDS